MKSIVVAYDKNYGIGASNDLLWIRDLPADLRHFKDITTGSTIIMGRKTYDSIGKPLPNRQNIVISRSMLALDDVLVVGSLDDAFRKAIHKNSFVIGGGQIFALSIKNVDKIYATEVDASFDAEVYFPKIEPGIWKEASREHHDKDEQNKYNYDFVIYERI